MFRTIKIYVNPDVGGVVTYNAPAVRLSSLAQLPSVYAGEIVVFQVRLINSSASAIPYANTDTFELAIDDNFLHTDNLMARAFGRAVPSEESSSSDPEAVNLPEDDPSGTWINPAQGQLTIRVNCNTVSFFAKLSASAMKTVNIELKRYPADQSTPTVLAQSPMTARNVVALDEGEPEPDDPLYYTTAQTLALLEGKRGPQGPVGPAAGFGTPTASASSLPAGSTPTASVSASGADTAKVFSFAFEIPAGAPGSQGPAGADGQLIGASLSVSALTSGYIVVSSDAAPVMLKTNLGNLYPVEKGTMTESSGTWSIDPAAYLAYDNVQTFTGPWIVYFAGGLPEVMTIISAGTSITPLEHQVYRHTLAASDAITVDTSGLTSSQCLTFELWLDMPSTAVTFTLPSGLTWIDEFTPDFSAGDTRYIIVIRWNGSGLLANLAYTEDLA